MLACILLLFCNFIGCPFVPRFCFWLTALDFDFLFPVAYFYFKDIPLNYQLTCLCFCFNWPFVFMEQHLYMTIRLVLLYLFAATLVYLHAFTLRIFYLIINWPAYSFVLTDLFFWWNSIRFWLLLHCYFNLLVCCYFS